MAEDPQPTLTALMSAVERGDTGASEALFAALYAELHSLARRELARSGAPVSLGITTLLHEAYLNMAERSGPLFPDQARFMGYAARVMRGLIIDHARRHCAVKRGGQFEITRLATNPGEELAEECELTPLSDALDEMAKADPALAEIVDLKFFCGFSFTDIAAMRGVSERTVQRYWEQARIYLHRSLRRSTPL
jgi:RNA polymerase sigma factor (TIGR02999 family)